MISYVVVQIEWKVLLLQSRLKVTYKLPLNFRLIHLNVCYKIGKCVSLIQLWLRNVEVT